VRIEFFGLPGTGKSFLCRQLSINATSKRGIRIKRQQFTKLINLFAELQKVDSTNMNVMTEQGVLQAIWSLEMQCKEEVASWLVNVYSRWLPSKVLIIEPPNFEFYVEQLSHRKSGRSQFDSLAKNEIALSMGRANNAVENILQLAKSERPNLKVMKLINDPFGP